MSGGRTLPIRLPPLPGEPLDGWLETYAHRLTITVGDLLTALGLRGAGHMAPAFTVCLRASEAQRMAALTGVSAERVHAMTLRVFDGRLVTLQPQRRAVTRSIWWSRGSGSRFCPQCLIERDGRWLLRWRLSWVFACCRHQVLLHDACPACSRMPRRCATFAAHQGGPACCAGRGCRTDLRDTAPIPLPTGDPMLAAQNRIDTILSAVESGQTTCLDAPPSRMVTDLRAVAGWLLRQGQDADFAGFGDRATAAWYAARDRAGTTLRLSQFPPTSAALMGAVTSQALDIVDGRDDARAVQRLRELLLRGPRRATTCPVGLEQQWQRLSVPLQGLFLRAGDDNRSAVDRLRYRSCVATARLPDPEAPTSRASSVPQVLWPGWTIRLLPVSGYFTDQFRSALAAALLLPGHPTRLRGPVNPPVHGHVPGERLHKILHDLAADRYDAVFTAICLLADYLDEHGSPIDYDRRRARVAPDAVLPLPDWQRLSDRTVVHRGRDRRPRAARRYLYQLLTGADLTASSCPLAYRDSTDRAGFLDFTISLTIPLRKALHERAAIYLRRLAIDEPLTWEPPAELCAGLRLPGCDPASMDRQAVRQLVSRGAAVSTVAGRLGVGMDHVRLLLADTPCAPKPVKRSGVAHTQRLRRKAEQVITREFLEREYVRGHRTVKQIAVQTGVPRYMVSDQVCSLGFTLGTGGLPAVDIDPGWLREQYLRRKRSFVAIAAELGVSDSTVARLATTYGIPARPAGIASHPQMIRKLGRDIPRSVRAAVEGGLHGWQRLARFETAMTFPTLRAAAEHLGAHPTALVTQFQRLERDIGTPLYHRATPGRPLRPTPQGSFLLRVLSQPDIHRLLLDGTSGGHRHTA